MNTENLETLDEKGAAPQERIKDYTAACGIVESLRSANDERNRKAAMIRGMFDGNPPFKSEALKSAGMAYYPNFNTLEGKAYLSSALVPYYDLFNGAPQQVEVSLDIPDENLRTRWSRSVSEELDRTIKESTWFEMQMWKMLADFVAFGKGYLVWPDPAAWKFRHVPWHRVLVPDGSDVDMDKWEYFAVLWNYTAHDLYKMIRNEQRATSAGWNADNVRAAIRMANRADPASNNDWVALQQQLKDNDLYADTQCAVIETGWLFVKEFSGKWSWYVVSLTGATDGRSIDDKNKARGYLYRRVGVYNNIREIIAPFFFEVMDGSVNGLSGLGNDIFASMQIKDRMACAKVNNVFMRSSIVLQAKSATAADKAALTQIGNVCIINDGYDVQQATILGDIESTIAVSRDIDLMLQSNTGVYRPQFEKPQGNPETATAARLRFTQGTVLGNSAVNRFHLQLDGAYDQLYKRIVKSGDSSAVTFRKWCEERGVPRGTLAKTTAVRSYRNIGNGNAFIRQETFGNIAAFYSQLPDDGKRNFLEDVVAAYTNSRKVERYVRTPQAANIPTRHEWEAGIENGTLKDGMPVTRVPDQDDNVHLQVHGRAIDEALTAAEQGGSNPMEVLSFVQMAIAHAVQVHIPALQMREEKEAAKQWMALYKDLAGRAGKIQQAIQRMAQQQQMAAQQTQTVMNDVERANYESQAKMQIRAAEKSRGLDIKQAVSAANVELAAERTAAEIALEQTRTTAEIQRKNIETAAEIRRKAVEAATKPASARNGD